MIKLTKFVPTIILTSQLGTCLNSACITPDLPLHDNQQTHVDLSLETRQINTQDLEMPNKGNMKRSAKIGIGLTCIVATALVSGLLYKATHKNLTNVVTERADNGIKLKPIESDDYKINFYDFYNNLRDKFKICENLNKPLNLGIIFTNFKTDQEFKNFLNINIQSNSNIWPNEPFCTIANNHKQYNIFNLNVSSQQLNIFTLSINRNDPNFFKSFWTTKQEDIDAFDKIRELTKFEFNASIVTFIINYEGSLAEKDLPILNEQFSKLVPYECSSSKRTLRRVSKLIPNSKYSDFWQNQGNFFWERQIINDTNKQCICPNLMAQMLGIK